MNINSTGFNVDYYPVSILPPNIAALLYLIAGVLVLFGIIIIISARRKGHSARNTTAGTILLLAGLAAGIFVVYKNHFAALEAPIFAPRTMLTSLWANYKNDYLDEVSLRAMDATRSNITTSEGQSYTMLRAVWMGDRETFDKSWEWTGENLQRPDDLFAWLYGTRPDGTQGILTEQGGMNPASDADTDIALALTLAYSRWQDESYLRAALPIVSAIWNKEVFIAGGKPYLAASIVNVSSTPQTGTVLVNPSYLAPYAYRIFAVIDRAHNWQGLIDASYDLLDKSITMPLDKETSAGLPPDWVMVSRATGELSAPPQGTALTTNFGYDAIRIPLRIAIDAIWNDEPRAIAFLEKLDVLSDKWASAGKLYAVYAHDGTPVTDYESPAMYGGTIGYFMVADPTAAANVYAKKLAPLYSQDIQTWRLPMGYYDANMAWFGLALYSEGLQNLFTLNFTTPRSSAVTTTAPRS